VDIFLFPQLELNKIPTAVKAIINFFMMFLILLQQYKMLAKNVSFFLRT
jgi:hypothetical protein